jgi:hypothetical protein
MKKIKNIVFFISITCSTLFVSCDKEDGTGYSTLNVVDGVTGVVNTPFSTNLETTEIDEGVYSYTVTLSKPQVVPIVINVSQVGGTAIAKTDDEDGDFDFDKTITIPALSTSGTGTFSIFYDTEEEAQESFTLRVGDIKTANATITSKDITVKINNSCVSALAGTYSYITTNCYTPGPPASSVTGPFSGSVILTEVSVGLYEISDASFGGWTGLYGSGVATGVKLKDECNKISFTGADQYNEIFTISNLVITGNKMSFHWENDYGEYGDTELTNPNGNWPALTL